MFRRLAAFAVVLFAISNGSGFVFGQIQRGAIEVKTMDAQGALMPGVSVAVTGETLAGAINGITDETGVYRAANLNVGVYTVTLSLPGFQTLKRENVQVVQSQTVNLDIQMQVGNVSQEISVTAESPVLDAKSTGVAVNIDKNLLDLTPGAKDIWGLLEYKAPGVIFDAPDVGGNQGGLQRALYARGTPNAQNTQLLNGVNVNDPSAQGFAMNYYIPTEFENVQVATGSQDISMGTGGVVINMVTKSGGNKFFLQAYESCQGNCSFLHTQAHNVDTPLLNQGLSSYATAVDYVQNHNFQIGGPIIKNKLFYFGSLNYQPTHVYVLGFPAVSPTFLASPLAKTSNQDTTDILAGSGKTSWQLNPKNRIEAYLSKQRYDKPNRGSSLTNTQDSDSKELDTFVIAQGIWNWIISDRMTAESRLSYNNTHFPLTQKTNLQPITDQTSNVLYRNRTSSALMYRRRLEMTSNWQYYLPQFMGGRHEFKWGFDFGHTAQDVTTTRVNDVNLNFASGKSATCQAPPCPVSVTLFNSPTLTVAAVNTLALYAQDSYSYKRLTVIGGIRWERLEGYLPAQSHLQSQFFPAGTTFNSVTFSYTTPKGPVSVTGPYTVPSSYPAVHDAPLWQNAVGRFAATYALTGSGRTVVKASVSKYLDQINTGTVANPNGTISQTYAWNNVQGDWNFHPGTLTWNGNNYVGAPGGDLGAQIGGSTIANAFGPLTFNGGLVRPSRNEVTAGIDREVMPNTLVSATYIYRREHNQQSSADANISLWSQMYSPVTLMEPGPDGLPGTADDRPITVYNLNPGQTVSTTTLSDDRLSQIYNGFEITLTKRYSKRWTALVGYDYGHTSQAILGLQNPNQVFVNGSGPGASAIGRRHQMNGSASYTLPWQNINLATEFRIQSGLPVTRQWTPNVCSPQTATPQALNCLNQSTAAQPINVIPRGSVELPWLGSADIRIGKTFKATDNNIFDVDFDIFNVTNANTTYSVGALSNTRNVHIAGDPAQPIVTIPNWLSATGVLGPRILRLGLRYSFSR
jgi:hypothetical protein